MHRKISTWKLTFNYLYFDLKIQKEHMKAKIFALLVTLFAATQVQAQTKPKIFVSADYSQNGECSHRPIGKFGADTIKDWAKAELIKSDFGIADTKNDATNGLEVKIKIAWCGVKIDNVESHSASLLIVALSNGTSTASPKLKDVPFSYFNDLLVAAGYPSEVHESSLRSTLKDSIEITLGGMFPSSQ